MIKKTKNIIKSVKIAFLLLFLLIPFHVFCVFYQLSDDPIDVVIPCAKKDAETLGLCIEGIKKYGKNIRSIIVVSSERFTDRALWFDEKKFPFSKETLADEIFRDDENSDAKENFLYGPRSRAGWLFQQFIKLYAAFIIPDISKNILVLDADTIFLRPVEFINEKNEPLFAYASEYHRPYFEIAKKILPYFQRVNDQLSGITHHMLFQKEILERLFSEIFKYANEEPWKAVCRRVNKNILHGSFFSEYELYFNFVLLTTDQGHLRHLKFKNAPSYKELDLYRKDNCSFISAHYYMRR